MKYNTSDPIAATETLRGGSPTPNSPPTMEDGESPKTVDLPPPDTKRWVSARKAQVVTAVRAGVITLEDACKRYALSIEEFVSWQQKLDRHGPVGLQVTHAARRRRG